MITELWREVHFFWETEKWWVTVGCLLRISNAVGFVVASHNANNHQKLGMGVQSPTIVRILVICIKYTIECRKTGRMQEHMPKS
jgi:hypothetical protein